MPELPTLPQHDAAYADWLKALKPRILEARQRAVRAVNLELLHLHWRIGNDILAKQREHGWGAKIIEQLSRDLRNAFPDMKGFSRSSLLYMRAFAENWREEEIVQAPLGQLTWYHHVTLLDKLGSRDERLAYARLAVAQGWSRNAMVHHIERGTARRMGMGQTNFATTLPEPVSDLARELVKDPYKIDFLGIDDEAREAEIQKALETHMTEFLLELGAGFAYIGRQFHLQVGTADFFADLLFYHVRLHCYVVIELKAREFRPEDIGQLSFYVTAVDRQVKDESDAPTIGLLLCKSKDKVVAEYALHNVNKPIGVSEYELTKAIPENLRASLPTIEELEKEFGH